MLEYANTRLRPLRLDDVDNCLSWLNDREVTKYLTNYLPITRMAEEKFLRRIDESPSDIVFAVETLDGTYLGNAGLHRIDHRLQRAELGIVIGNKQYWGKGHGSEAVMLLLQYAFEDLNLHRVYLHVLADNQRAIRCYSKCGFVREGVLRRHQFSCGQFVDLVVMGVLREEFQQLFSK